MLRHLQQSARLPALAATLAASLALTVAAPVAMPDGLGAARMAQAQQPSQFASILADYGAFQAHAKYGEVWIPARTTVPEGWHPYPACNWVYAKDLGWYFDDKTEWGRIVHHYGRWAHDRDLGWMWVKGEEFSPGWVVWRTSDKWVGWAPLPPDQDIREVSAENFNNDKHWTFIEAEKFGKTCAGTTLVSTPPSLYPALFTQTRLVTEVKLVHGIAIFVLPPPLIVNVVDIDINVFHPWSPCFFGAWFWNWNWVVNNVVVNVNLPGPQCNPQAVPAAKHITPIKSLPPPPPPVQTAPPRPDRRVQVPIDPGFVRPVRPSGPIVELPQRPQIPPGLIGPSNPGGSRKPVGPGRQIDPGKGAGPSQVGQLPNGPTTKPGSPQRHPVSKLVRTPQTLQKYPGLMHGRQAGKTGGSQIR